MSNSKSSSEILLSESASANFDRDGFAVVKIFDQREGEILEDFAKRWLLSLFDERIKKGKSHFAVEQYHHWTKVLDIPHNDLFRAPRRHCVPPKDIEAILLNSRAKDFLAEIGIKEFTLWNEGLGWLGFRLIRPASGDGYPFTCKAWGIAKEVISCWVPIVGFRKEQTVALVPGSHRKEYEHYLPAATKFRKDEYRLAAPLSAEEIFRPDLEKGEVIFFHPRLLHSEEIKEGDTTRLSLEFRICPQS